MSSLFQVADTWVESEQAFLDLCGEAWVIFS